MTEAALAGKTLSTSSAGTLLRTCGSCHPARAPALLQCPSLAECPNHAVKVLFGRGAARGLLPSGALRPSSICPAACASPRRLVWKGARKASGPVGRRAATSARQRSSSGDPSSRRRGNAGWRRERTLTPAMCAEPMLCYHTALREGWSDGDQATSGATGAGRTGESSTRMAGDGRNCSNGLNDRASRSYRRIANARPTDPLML